MSARRGGASCAPGKCRAPLPGRAGGVEPPVLGAFGQRSRRAGRLWALRAASGWTSTVLVALQNVEFGGVICGTAANGQALRDVQVLDKLFVCRSAWLRFRP